MSLWDLLGWALIFAAGVAVGRRERGERKAAPVVEAPVVEAPVVEAPVVEVPVVEAPSLSPDVAPPGASAIEADLWWIMGRLKIRVRAYDGFLGVCVQSPADSERLWVGYWLDGQTEIKVGSKRIYERRSTTVHWQWCGYGVIRAPFSGDFGALQEVLRRHPAGGAF